MISAYSPELKCWTVERLDFAFVAQTICNMTFAWMLMVKIQIIKSSKSFLKPIHHTCHTWVPGKAQARCKTFLQEFTQSLLLSGSRRVARHGVNQFWKVAFQSLIDCRNTLSIFKFWSRSSLVDWQKKLFFWKQLKGVLDFQLDLRRKNWSFFFVTKFFRRNQTFPFRAGHGFVFRPATNL